MIVAKLTGQAGFRERLELTGGRIDVILSEAKDLPAMAGDYRYYVCIMATHSCVLYIGVTSDLQRRVYQHKKWHARRLHV